MLNHFNRVLPKIFLDVALPEDYFNETLLNFVHQPMVLSVKRIFAVSGEIQQLKKN